MLKIKKNGKEYLPADDGISHINAYSRSNTVLGRWLSNFASTQVELEFGVFASLEALYHYLKIVRSYEVAGEVMPDEIEHALERLKGMCGRNAQTLGRTLKQTVRQSGIRTMEEPDSVFNKRFTQGMCVKFMNDEDMLDNLLDTVDSGIPILHYYVVNNDTIILLCRQ